MDTAENILVGYNTSGKTDGSENHSSRYTGRAKGDPGKLPAEERDIVTYVRQLMRTNRVDQAVFDALKNRHDAQWMVELTAAANYFAMLSGVVNAFEVAAPADGDKLPA